MDITPNAANQKRLIVILPESLAGNMDLTRKIYWMGSQGHYEIVYLTLVDDPERMLSASLSMATMRAMTSDNVLTVQSVQSETRHWLKTLKEIYTPGDIVVCQAEQTVKAGFFQTVLLQDFLNEALHAPTITLSGYYHPERVQVGQWLRGLLFWIGCLILVAAFFALGVRFDALAHGIARTLLGIMGVVVEIGAIWAWTRIMNR